MTINTLVRERCRRQQQHSLTTLYFYYLREVAVQLGSVKENLLGFCLRKNLISKHKTSTHISPKLIKQSWRSPLELYTGDHTVMLVSYKGRLLDTEKQRTFWF